MDIIQRSQAGDEAAFAELFERYKNLVYRTAFMMLDSEREAEDILQNVFVKVYGALGSYDPGKGAFTTWLHRITVNECLNRKRKHRPDPLPSTEVAASQNGHASSPERAVEIKQIVQSALHVLSQKLRVVVVLRYGWGLTYQEISEVLNIPTGTVKSRMNAALHQMRDALRGDGLIDPHNHESSMIHQENSEVME